jgi:group I intron endonuclease
MARGIYKIINAINNKFYVGSAVNFEKRKARHLWRLRRGDHVNKKLQAAWDKYGKTAFVFAFVQEVPETEDLLAAENVWLFEHVGKDYCYNIATDATAPTRGWTGEKNPMWGRTFSHTKDAKARIGAASKVRVQSEEEKAKRRETMKGHKVSTATRAKISQTLSGEGNFWYGKQRPDHGAKVSKAVIAVHPDGTETVYDSISKLREDLGLKPPTVNRAVKNEKPLVRGPYKGWIFKYLDTPPKQA